MPEPRITANPSVYIDIHFPSGDKVSYDVPTARMLHEELGRALNAFESMGRDEPLSSDTELTERRTARTS
jgi:hypothetical protein